MVCFFTFNYDQRMSSMTLVCVAFGILSLYWDMALALALVPALTLAAVLELVLVVPSVVKMVAD